MEPAYRSLLRQWRGALHVTQRHGARSAVLQTMHPFSEGSSGWRIGSARAFSAASDDSAKDSEQHSDIKEEGPSQEPLKDEGDNGAPETEDRNPEPGIPTVWDYQDTGVAPFLVATAPVGSIFSLLAGNMEPIEEVRQGCVQVFKTVMKLWKEGNVEELREILHPKLIEKLQEEIAAGHPGGSVLDKQWEVLSSQFVGYFDAADYRENSATQPGFNDKKHGIWFPFFPVKRFGAIDLVPNESMLAQALRLYPTLEKRRIMRLRVVFQAMDKKTLAALKKQEDWPTYRLLYETPLPGRVDINAFQNLQQSLPEEGTQADGSEGLRHLRFFSFTFEKTKLVRPAQEDQAAAKGKGKEDKAKGDSASKGEKKETGSSQQAVEQEAFFSLGGMLGQTPAAVEDSEYGWRIVDINFASPTDSYTFEPMMEHVLEHGRDMMGPAPAGLHEEGEQEEEQKPNTKESTGSSRESSDSSPSTVDVSKEKEEKNEKNEQLCTRSVATEDTVA